MNHYKKCCKACSQFGHKKFNNRRAVHELEVDKHPNHDDTFYVDGIEFDECINTVSPHMPELEEGFVTLHINKNLFTNKLGELQIMYAMTVDPSVLQVVRPTHRIPLAMQSHVRAELVRMQSLGVIWSHPWWLHTKRSDKKSSCVLTQMILTLP